MPARCVPLAVRALLAIAAALAWNPAAATPRDEDLFLRPIDQRVVVFGSFDAGRSVFASGGSKQALTGPLDRPGFMALESAGFGLTVEKLRLEDRTFAVTRLTYLQSALGGHQWMEGPVYVAAYAGPEIHEEQLAYDGRIYRPSQPRLGVRGQVELWTNPSPDTLLTATVVSGSARAHLWARVSAGIKVAPGVFVGPEVTTYVTPTYTETRWGGHVTGATIGIVNLRASAGWMTDDAHRRGSPYGGLSAWIRM